MQQTSVDDIKAKLDALILKYDAQAKRGLNVVGELDALQTLRLQAFGERLEARTLLRQIDSSRSTRLLDRLSLLMDMYRYEPWFHKLRSEASRRAYRSLINR